MDDRQASKVLRWLLKNAIKVIIVAGSLLILVASFTDHKYVVSKYAAVTASMGLLLFFELHKLKIAWQFIWVAAFLATMVVLSTGRFDMGTWLLLLGCYVSLTLALAVVVAVRARRRASSQTHD